MSPLQSLFKVNSALGSKANLPKIPSRTDFLKTIEGTKNSKELIDEIRHRFALKQAYKED